MATGTMTPTITSTSRNQDNLIVFGTIAVSAGTDTYATGGLVCSFAGLDTLKTSATKPVWISIMSAPAAGTSPSGWLYNYCYGTSLATGKVAIFGSNSSATNLAEYGNGSALTTVATDVITFRAEFTFS